MRHLRRRFVAVEFVLFVREGLKGGVGGIILRHFLSYKVCFKMGRLELEV